MSDVLSFGERKIQAKLRFRLADEKIQMLSTTDVRSCSLAIRHTWTNAGEEQDQRSTVERSLSLSPSHAILLLLPPQVVSNVTSFSRTICNKTTVTYNSLLS